MAHYGTNNLLSGFCVLGRKLGKGLQLQAVMTGGGGEVEGAAERGAPLGHAVRVKATGMVMLRSPAQAGCRLGCDGIS